MSRTIKLFSGAIIASFVAFSAYLYFGHPEDRMDALCALAQNDFKMNCSILAAPGVYERGAIVNLVHSTADASPKIGFPIQQIFGDSCTVGISKSSFSTFQEQSGQSVIFGKREITVDRSLSAGAKLNIPEAASFDLQGGPNVSDVRSILLNAESAQVFTIDRTALQDAINSCSVRASCTRSISSNQGVVTRLLVAKNLQYSVKDKSGAVFPLEVAAEKGMIKLRLRAGRDTISTTELSSGKDMVFALSTSSASEFNFDACQSSLKMMEVTGSAKATAVTRKDIAKEQQSLGDGEASAHVRYVLPDDERNNESISHAEAFAATKWTAAPEGGDIFLDSTVFAISGMRWPYSSDLLKTTYAPSTATTELNLEASMVNRDLKGKQLFLVMKIDQKSSRDLDIYQTLAELSVMSADGSSRNIPAIWQRGDREKELSLGKIEPGHLTQVRLKRVFKAASTNDKDGGKMMERLIISFQLRDTQ